MENVIQITDNFNKNDIFYLTVGYNFAIINWSHWVIVFRSF